MKNEQFEESKKAAIKYAEICINSHHKEMVLSAFIKGAEWQAEQQKESIDWETMSIKLLDIVCHYNLGDRTSEVRDKILYALQSSLLPLPYKPWKKELEMQKEAGAFAEWIIDKTTWVNHPTNYGNSRPAHPMATEQLYETFKKQQNANNPTHE